MKEHDTHKFLNWEMWLSACASTSKSGDKSMYTSLCTSVSEITTEIGQCSIRTEAESNPGVPGSGDIDRNPLAFHRFRVDQPVTTASQVGTVTESPAQSTTLAAREVVAQKPNTEEMPQAQDGKSKRNKLKHHGCEYGIHTDACWNDPRWDESNKESKARLADLIANGDYRLMEKHQNEICNGKYQSVSSSYMDWDNGHAYCNYKITRCTDGEVLVDLNRNESISMWECFKRNGEDWLAICNGSPVLVNLTTEETFEQSGDHHYPDDLTWFTVEISPDGNTLLASGAISKQYHSPIVNQFFDFSHPERGFRQLPSVWLEEPDWGDEDVKWDTDRDNNTTATLVVASDNYNDEDEASNNDDDLCNCCGIRRFSPPEYRVTLRREGNQMVEINRKPVGKKK